MIKWPDNPLKPKPAEKREGKIVDWLKEQRHKRSIDADYTAPTVSTKSYDWQKELEKKDLRGRDRYEIYLEKAKEFEEKAQRKQQLIMSQKGGGSINDIIQVNDMYVESIKAKLEVLNGLD